MNLSAILADAYRRLRYATSPPATVVTRLTAFANKVQADILSMPGMRRLRDDVIPVTLAANAARQGLPPLIGRIHAITDRINNIRLKQVALTELRSDDPAQAYTGTYALRYAVVGNQEVAIQPTTSGSGLWVSSSATGDVGNVFVEAARLGGFPFYDNTQTTLAGTTRVTVKSINTTGVQTDYIQVDRFYLASTAAAGYVSLWDAAVAGNELARIPIGNTFSRYLAIEVWPVPTATEVVWVDFSRVIPDMINGTDEPLLPVDFHDLIPIGMRVEEYEFLDDSRVALARAELSTGLQGLMTWMLDNPDRIASLRPVSMRWSRLGGAFPSEPPWGWP